LNRTFAKLSARNIKSSLSRFLSILAIVALGTGFLAGLTATTPDMKQNTDRYYDSHDACDLKVQCSRGLTDADRRYIKKMDGVRDVAMVHMDDMVMKTADDEVFTSRVTGTDFDIDKKDEINRTDLIRGRFPEKNNECVICVPNAYGYTHKIGEMLTISDKNKNYDDIDVIYKEKKFKVVGIVRSPLYLSAHGEYTNVGTGKISLAVFVRDAVYDQDVWSAAYIIMTGTQKLDTFSEKYRSRLAGAVKEFEKAGEKRSRIRKDQLTDDALSKMMSGIYASSSQQSASAAVYSASESVLRNNIEKKIGEVKWYVTDRRDEVGYASFKSDVTKVAAVAKVFPVFFFLIAALVALTTMTRLVEEERLQTGTLKSLGYRSGSILGYYLLYGIAACALGCAVGLAVGFRLFPAVINNAYRMMYNLPALSPHFIPYIGAVISAVTIICIMVTIWAACRNELKERPASLLVPKASRAGRRVFLEKIGPLWKRIKFSWKVTIRNLFRYKKRFFMTIIGVAGCFALLMAGFGVRDSIGGIVDKQYNEINKYDMSISVSDAKYVTKDKTIRNVLGDSDMISVWGRFSDGAATISAKGKTEKTDHLTVPAKDADLSRFITLRDRKSGRKIGFGKNSVVITEKMADNLGVGRGSRVKIKNSDGETHEFTVTGTTENYVQSDIYMSREKYQAAFGGSEDFSLVLAKIAPHSGNSADKVSAALLESDHIKSVMSSATVKKNFRDSVKSIDYIVIVLIISAGVLAMIVLYNLINVNICERKKELATIRVLGFFDREVFSYIFREINILSVIGMVIGIPAGIILHKFVIYTVEVEDVMFGRMIYWQSYLYSILITLAFTLLVELIMRRSIRKIDMVESMKAND